MYSGLGYALCNDNIYFRNWSSLQSKALIGTKGGRSDYNSYQFYQFSCITTKHLYLFKYLKKKKPTKFIQQNAGNQTK